MCRLNLFCWEAGRIWHRFLISSDTPVSPFCLLEVIMFVMGDGSKKQQSSLWSSSSLQVWSVTFPLVYIQLPQVSKIFLKDTWTQSVGALMLPVYVDVMGRQIGPTLSSYKTFLWSVIFLPQMLRESKVMEWFMELSPKRCCRYPRKCSKGGQ